MPIRIPACFCSSKTRLLAIYNSEISDWRDEGTLSRGWIGEEITMSIFLKILGTPSRRPLGYPWKLSHVETMPKTETSSFLRILADFQFKTLCQIILLPFKQSILSQNSLPLRRFTQNHKPSQESNIEQPINMASTKKKGMQKPAISCIQ